MPYKEPDTTDPMMFVGVALPGGPEVTQDMAYAFAEEFARLGYSEEKILHLFRTPFYRGAHGAYASLGEDAIQTIVRECVDIWGRIRHVDQETENGLIPPGSIQTETPGTSAQ